MTKYPHSKHGNRSKRKPRGVTLARLNERRRIGRNNLRHDARPKKDIALKSSATLVARSEELLTSLLEKYGSTTTRHDIFKGLLKAKLGEKFRRMQRKHRQKALAVASALYHVISRKPDPAAALHTLVQRMNVSPPRSSDSCRTFVECLFDYGSTAEEKTHNRQYACADANALRYIIRMGIEPQKVLTPEEGESITKWAKREAKYRRQKTRSSTRSKVPEAERSTKSKGKLPVLRPSERRYRALQKWAKKGVILVEPTDDGRTLVVTVTELAGLTVNDARRRPDKIRSAIQKMLDKAIQRVAEKPPLTPLVRRRVFDDGRSVSSGPGILSKPVGEAPLEKPAGAQNLESPSP